MSKGKGGVYFILYLAVLLELLIIIVERDEAEEHLKKEQESLRQKNKRIQLIAETIINALRGSQTSLSSTSNQSMTLGDPKEPEREFLVKVRVSDPARDSVNDLSLAIYRNDTRVDSLLITSDTALYPRVKVGQDYIFNYKFKPSYGEGVYKLRFSARTNQVIGVAPGASENDTVKIGAVQLTVKELKEVKNGIAENVQLRGYIDSLLSDQYRDFSTNIGNNEFVVDVKRPEAKVFDQLAVQAQLSDFNSFPGIELPNPLRIEGAEAKSVQITKTEGPGEITKIDTNWYWIYKPAAGEAGQTYTVRYSAKANRGGGPKDLANGQFSVSVKPFAPADSTPFEPLDEDNKPVAYTKVLFKINQLYQGLDGSYKLKLTLDGQDLKTVEGATYEFRPEFGAMEGKVLGIQTLFKSPYSKEYVEISKESVKILAPPFNATFGKTYYDGDPMTIRFKAGYGIDGDFSEIDGDLNVTSDGGVFDSKATKGEGINYTVRILKNPNKTDKKGKDINVTLTDPKTGQSKSKIVRFFPKRK
jgi:hypothetical protein